MSLHLDSDGVVSVIALFVSLLAFTIAILQVIQQYASTAYEYRKCSSRTMGGWATQTKRIFVPSEIRFEITYAVPHIELDPFSREKYQIKNTPVGFTAQKQKSPKLLRAVRRKSMKTLRTAQQSLSSTPCGELAITQINALYYSVKYSEVVRKSKRLLASTSKIVASWYQDVLSWDTEDDSRVNPEPFVDMAEPERCWCPKLREDWFLSLGGAAPDAACSWLRLLHDTQATDFNYIITAKRLSIDYLPPAVTRPLATADLHALLIALTYLGVQWKDRGAGGIFVGRSPRNGIEVTTTNIPSVGTVYSYERTSPDPLPLGLAEFHSYRRYMFNQFPLTLSNKDISTWDKDEIRESLVDIFKDAELANYFSQHYKPGGLNIGIGEFIASWCADSMPRRRYSKDNILNSMFPGRRPYSKGRDTTESVFSASSLGCTFGMPLLSAILCNGDLDLQKILVEYALDKEEFIPEFIDMIKGYYSSLEGTPGCGTHWLNRLSRCLKWASEVPARSNILFYSKSSSFPRFESWDLIRVLDRMATDGFDRVQFGMESLKAYIVEDPPSMQGTPEDKTKSPMREAVLLTAKASVKAAKALSEQPQALKEQYFWSNLVMNRILRGVLWTIENGNAPGRDPFAEDKDRNFDGDRSLECSLSFKQLERLKDAPETVYIS